jgi:hypothetical protein
MYYILKTQKRCTLKKLHQLCFHVIHVVQCFPHVFYIISMLFFMWKQHEPFYQQNLYKKAQILLSYQVRDVYGVLGFFYNTVDIWTPHWKHSWHCYMHKWYWLYIYTISYSTTWLISYLHVKVWNIQIISRIPIELGWCLVNEWNI